MISAIVKLFRNRRKRNDLAKQLAVARLELFEAKQHIKTLSEQNIEYKNSKNFLGAIPKEVYKKKILDKIGHAYLGAQDDSAFKLGIQFALRHVEVEIVQD